MAKVKTRYGVYVGDRLAYVSTKKLDSDKASRKLRASGASNITGKMVGPNPVSGKIPPIGWRAAFKVVARQKLGPKRVTTPVGRTLRRTRKFGGQVTAAARRAVNPRRRNGDAEVGELKVFIDNDGQLYRSQTTSIYKNLINKMAKGVYNKTLAVKLMRYLVDNGAKKYHRDMDIQGEKWSQTFSVSDRNAVARNLVEDFEDEASTGSYDNWLQKQYQGKWSGDGGKIKKNPYRAVRRTKTRSPWSKVIAKGAYERRSTPTTRIARNPEYVLWDSINKKPYARGRQYTFSTKTEATQTASIINRQQGRTGVTKLTVVTRSQARARKNPRTAHGQGKYYVYRKQSGMALGSFDNLTEARREAKIFSHSEPIEIWDNDKKWSSPERWVKGKKTPARKRNAPSMLLRRENPREGYIVEVGKSRAIAWVGRTKAEALKIENALLAAGKKAVTYKAKLPASVKDGVRKAYKGFVRLTKNPARLGAAAKRKSNPQLRKGSLFVVRGGSMHAVSPSARIGSVGYVVEGKSADTVLARKVKRVAKGWARVPGSSYYTFVLNKKTA